MDLGVRLLVLAGPTVPLPLPGPVAERIVSVTAIETDGGRSGFSITLDPARAGMLDAIDSFLLSTPQLRIGARVSIVLMVGPVPMTLADGFLTRLEHRPADGGSAGELVWTGEDASWLLDREEVARQFPMDDYIQVMAVLAPYSAQGIIPFALPPVDMDPPLPIERVPQQRGTDLAHLAELARRHGYVSYAMPGPAPGTSTWYWGPQVRLGIPQPAITIGQLPSSNVVGSVSFSLDAHAPVTLTGRSTDRRTGQTLPVRTAPPTRIPLATEPTWAVAADSTRVRIASDDGSSIVGTLARAQAEVDGAADAVTATGVLDGARYGSVLRPRGLVGVRGAGRSHDGFWYVRSVEHTWRPGAWQQSFTLSRDGLGSTTPAVMP